MELLEPRNMESKFDFDDIFITGPSDRPPSPEVPRPDSVFWASTQPTVLKDILKRVQEHPMIPEPINEPVPLDSPVKSKPRALLRRQSSLRARLGASAKLHNPLPEPNVTSEDRRLIHSIFKAASETLDEGVVMRAAEGEGTINVKRKSSVAKVGKAKRTMAAQSPRIIINSARVHRIEDGRKENYVKNERELRSMDNRLSLHSSLSSSTSTALSTPNTSITTDIELTDISTMDIDTGENPITVCSRFPPATKPLTRNHSGSSFEAGVSPKNPVSVTPAPRMHPLLVHQQTRRQRPTVSGSANPTSQHQAQPQPQLPPPRQHVSQSSKAPALGMRRNHTMPSAIQQPFARKKAFKPPLLSQPQPATQAHPQPLLHGQPHLSRTPATHAVSLKGSNMRGNVESGQRVNPTTSNTLKTSSLRADISMQEIEKGDEQPAPSRAVSPEANLEADSSFGDMSFDMDALEETMSKYD